MITIPRQLMDAFSRQALRDFENRMMDHLRKRFPRQSDQLGDASLRTMIQNGIVMAGRYAVTDQYDVRRYLEYMIVLSRDFDTDPGTSWAAAILHNHRLDGTAKMNLVDDTFLYSIRG